MDLSSNLVFLTFITTCDLSSATPKYFSNRYLQSNNLQQTIKTVIKGLRWTSASILYDGEQVDAVPDSVKQQQFHIDVTDMYTALDRIHSSSFPDINIIIAVSKTWTKRIVKMIDKYDFISNGTTDYRHHSKILLMMRDISELIGVEEEIHHLENVAVCVITADKHKFSVNDIEMYTLHIHPARRVFTPYLVTAKNILLESMYPNIKFGYNNRRLLVTTLESEPTVVKQILHGKVFYTGYVFDIWNTVATRLNISYEVTEPQDRDWGILKNGQWNGIVSQLIKWEVDIAIADLTVSYERAQYIDFVFPTVLADTTDIIYKRQFLTENTFFILLGPLQRNVYLAFFALLGGSIIIFFVTEQHSPKHVLRTPFIQRKKLCNELFCITWKFVCSLMRQEFKLLPITYAGKLLLSSWWILVLLISWIYSGNLIAALFSKSVLSKFSSIDELVDSDYTTGSYKTGLEYGVLSTTNRPELQRLFSKMKEDSKYDSGIFLDDNDAQMTRVKAGSHGYIIHASRAERYMAEDCHLALIGEPIIWAGQLMAFGLPKGSPMKADIENTMSQLKESGIFDLWWKKWNSGNATSSCILDKEITSITMREVEGGFLVVCAGLGLSLVILVVELCILKVCPNMVKYHE